MGTRLIFRDLKIVTDAVSCACLTDCVCSEGVPGNSFFIKTPLSKRQDRPDAALWLLKNFPQFTDGQISKLVGSTKGTVSLIRKRSYWNFSNLKAKDPVILGLCSQEIFEKALGKANRRIEREKKALAKEEKLKAFSQSSQESN
jgi:hypothetical protein